MVMRHFRMTTQNFWVSIRFERKFSTCRMFPPLWPAPTKRRIVCTCFSFGGTSSWFVAFTSAMSMSCSCVGSVRERSPAGGSRRERKRGGRALGGRAGCPSTSSSFTVAEPPPPPSTRSSAGGMPWFPRSPGAGGPGRRGAPWPAGSPRHCAPPRTPTRSRTARPSIHPQGRLEGRGGGAGAGRGGAAGGEGGRALLPSLEERRETPIWKRSPAIPRPFFSVPAASLWEEDIAPRPACPCERHHQAGQVVLRLWCGGSQREGGWGDGVRISEELPQTNYRCTVPPLPSQPHLPNLPPSGCPIPTRLDKLCCGFGVGGWGDEGGLGGRGWNRAAVVSGSFLQNTPSVESQSCGVPIADQLVKSSLGPAPDRPPRLKLFARGNT